MRTLLIWLLLVLPLSAETPDKTMELCEELFVPAGPGIGCRFVESCYLLTLGGMRPYGAWNGFMTDPKPEDDAALADLNRFLEPRGLRLEPQGKASFSLYSLEGLERCTGRSRLSWVPPFRHSEGWEGFERWKKECFRRLDQVPCRLGQTRGHLFEGLMLGYPDAAIEHYEELNPGSPTTITSFAPAIDYYECGLPAYDLRAQDINHPEILACEKDWGDFLRAAYESEPHRRLEQNPAFRDARRDRLHWNWKGQIDFTSREGGGSEGSGVGGRRLEPGPRTLPP
ncbi:MAG: hypothetical protein HY319_07340 [Armatimonadetes bacterium]|nr:hypothetical protein [Armatimonadota bacterium]